MNTVIQWALAGLIVLGYISIWCLDLSRRATTRIQNVARRNVAEQKRAVANLRQHAADWGQLNQERAEINAQYEETVIKIRRVFGVEGEL
jgi:glycine/D-amino acid oxidase-like deaminating enzyme